MARSKKTWTTLLAEIRSLYGETTAANSAFSDAQLLMFWNDNLDLRIAQMADVDEDWITSTVNISLVSGTASYALAAGSNSVKEVRRVITSGGITKKVPLQRDDKWVDGEITAGAAGTSESYFPTWRLQGGNILFDPAPAFSASNAIEVETEPFPAYFTAGGDTLADSYPDMLQTLLKYDTVLTAMSAEGSLGNADEGFANHILARRNELEAMFVRLIERRQKAPVFSRRYSLGG